MPRSYFPHRPATHAPSLTAALTSALISMVLVQRARACLQLRLTPTLVSRQAFSMDQGGHLDRHLYAEPTQHIITWIPCMRGCCAPRRSTHAEASGEAHQLMLRLARPPEQASPSHLLTCHHPPCHAGGPFGERGTSTGVATGAASASGKDSADTSVETYSSASQVENGRCDGWHGPEDLSHMLLESIGMPLCICGHGLGTSSSLTTFHVRIQGRP